MDKIKENKVMTVVTNINLVLICLCIIGCLYGIAITKDVCFIVDALVEIIALIASITYFAMGYKKDAAKYYKMFMLLQAASFIVEFFVSTFMKGVASVEGWAVSVSLILYGNTLLLAIAKDLGKKSTISIAAFNFAVYSVVFILSFLRNYASSVIKTDSILMAATWFSLAGITLLMTIAKYIDKAKRNTK